MRIVVLDGHTLNPGDNPWTSLGRLGDLTVHERTPTALVVERASGAPIVLTNKTRLGPREIEELPELRFIAVLATGFDVVDVEAARRRKVPVSNVPEYGTDSVAQHVFALLLELCHRVGLHDAAVHAGEWSSSPDFSFWKQSPVELSGLTLGLVGLGRIGGRVAALGKAFGMEVVPTGRPGRGAVATGGVRRLSIEEVFATADDVSLHCPATPDTVGLVGPRLLSCMKRGAFLINTARGSLVDEPALAEALADGRLAGAAVDVVSAEPIRPDNPLLHAPRCILTPHLAWASLSARRRLMDITVRNVEAFLAGSPIHVVNGW